MSFMRLLASMQAFLYLQFSQNLSFVLCVFSVQSFDLAKHLKTAPELVNRVFNRPTLQTLETRSVQGDVKPKSIKVRLTLEMKLL